MTPLHHAGDFLRSLLMQVPLGVVRAVFVLLLAGLLVWVLTLPRTQTTRSKPAVRLTENLKFWAAAALVIQIVIYLLL
jgi:hypothetical protein